MPKITPRWLWEPKGSVALFINLSGGTQSCRLVLEVARGEVEITLPVYAIFANPGMESSGTYRYLDWLEKHLEGSKVRIIRAGGPNLYEDILKGNLQSRNPPYWVKKPDGKRGKLRQKCTGHYKVASIRKTVRRVLARDFGVPSNRSVNIPFVEQWIGFTSDEESRVQGFKHDCNFIWYRFPLHERGIDKQMNGEWYLKRGLPMPPRSLCNGCFAHGLNSLKEMYTRRDGDWEQAVAVDEKIRDMRMYGVDNPCYVSSSLVPLRQLAEQGFKLKDNKETARHECNTGLCFV